MPLHANGTNCVKVFERQLLINSGRVLKQCYLHNNSKLHSKFNTLQMIWLPFLSL